MDNFREQYFQALGTTEEKKLTEVLKLAHDIRQFEIELYWKRAAYFWAFQLIAFTALGLLFKDGHIAPLGKLSLGRLLIPAPIGVITAFAGYLTARGSKFWQENWEAHVDLLEDKTNERLTGVVMCRDVPQFSVSRINQRLLLYLTIGWASVLVVGASPTSAEYLRGHASWLGLTVSAITLGLVCGLLGTRTHFVGSIYHLGDKVGWTGYPANRRNNLLSLLRHRKSRVPFIIWRDHPPKKAD